MDWIKRNLYFLIGGVVALVLMGMAGWFLYSKWELNNSVFEQLNTDYDTLRTLNNETPHPGAGKINNIALAKEQQEQVLGVIQKVRDKFVPIDPIPDTSPVTDRDFSAALSTVVAQLQRDATNASVIIPDKYHFSFEAQYSRITFASNSLAPLAQQLGEVKAIADVLIQAKVNYLDSIRRVRVSSDDNSGPQTDYTDKKSITNDLAILTPYEVTFRCFSSELATVLSAFASSPQGIVVKAINVERAPAPVMTEMPVASTSYYTPTVTQPNPSSSYTQASRDAAFSRRYGIAPGGGGGRYGSRYGGSPYGAAQPTASQPLRFVSGGSQASTPGVTRGGLQTVLDEKQLKITLALTVTKLLPPAKQ